MTYKRFEDLPVWDTAIRLSNAVYELSDVADNAFRRRASLRNQLGRAALSVSNNIAEGFERGTTNELLTFLYIARGSAGEVRSMLLLMQRMQVFDDFKSEISNLKSLAEQCSRQLRAWAQTLQDSNIKGQRHLSSSSREEYQRAKEHERFERQRAEFLAEVAEEVRQHRGF